MSRLALLPLDISTSCLLPYIRPKDFDAFCFSCPRLESWSLKPESILHYLSVRDLSFFPNKGLHWAIRNNSSVLTRCFLSLKPKKLNISIQEAAARGNINVVNYYWSME